MKGASHFHSRILTAYATHIHTHARTHTASSVTHVVLEPPGLADAQKWSGHS